jgi:zinc finger SWIM domain-containing protein 3
MSTSIPDNNDPIIGQNEEKFMLEECPSDDGEGDQNVVPYVGMRFQIDRDAYTFYNRYAEHVGFSVRKATQSKSKQGVSSMRFVCNKQGFGKRQKEQEMSIGSSNRPKTSEKEKSMTRVGCQASFRIRLVEGDIWEESVFEENHNHPLVISPSKKRNLRSQKHISVEETNIILNLSAQNAGTSQILEFIASHCGGGKGNLRFKKQNMNNLIGAIKRKLMGIDVKTVLMHFQKKYEEDPQFFYAIEPDENGVVKNFF